MNHSLAWDQRVDAAFLAALELFEKDLPRNPQERSGKRIKALAAFKRKLNEAAATMPADAGRDIAANAGERDGLPAWVHDRGNFPP